MADEVPNRHRVRDAKGHPTDDLTKEGEAWVQAHGVPPARAGASSAPRRRPPGDATE